MTFDRAAVLDRTLRAVQAQTRPPDEIIVVDNASTDATADRLAAAFPEVRVVRAKENLGYGAGLALGLRSCAQQRFDFHWLMDDDSRPAPEALARLLGAAAGIPRLGLLGLRGGSLRGGWVRHLKLPEQVVRRPLLAPGVRAMDFVLVDGALVTRPAVEVAGVPREDLFMMMEDIEYSHRIGRAGFRIGVLERDLMERDNLGQHGGPGKALWRSYYKSRNHVRIALESRSPLLIAGCLARQLRFLASAVLAKERRAERLRLLAAGWRDGLLGRMGRTLEPGSGGERG